MLGINQVVAHNGNGGRERIGETGTVLGLNARDSKHAGRMFSMHNCQINPGAGPEITTPWKSYQHEKNRNGLMPLIDPYRRYGSISGDFYPAFLFFGVRGGAKRRRSHHRGASGGSGWRLAPRNNFMVETLEKNRSWTRYFLARELRKSLKPERRRR